MKAVGKYDSALQMFVEEPREPDMNRLTFLRWLIENDRVSDDGQMIGPSIGAFMPVVVPVPALTPPPSDGDPLYY